MWLVFSPPDVATHCVDPICGEPRQKMQPQNAKLAHVLSIVSFLRSKLPSWLTELEHLRRHIHPLKGTEEVSETEDAIHSGYVQLITPSSISTQQQSHLECTAG